MADILGYKGDADDPDEDALLAEALPRAQQELLEHVLAAIAGLKGGKEGGQTTVTVVRAVLLDAVLPPLFSDALRHATALPVLDMFTLVDFAFAAATDQPRFGAKLPDVAAGQSTAGLPKVGVLRFDCGQPPPSSTASLSSYGYEVVCEAVQVTMLPLPAPFLVMCPHPPSLPCPYPSPSSLWCAPLPSLPAGAEPRGGAEGRAAQRRAGGGAGRGRRPAQGDARRGRHHGRLLALCALRGGRRVALDAAAAVLPVVDGAGGLHGRALHAGDDDPYSPSG